MSLLTPTLFSPLFQLQQKLFEVNQGALFPWVGSDLLAQEPFVLLAPVSGHCAALWGLFACAAGCNCT